MRSGGRVRVRLEPVPIIFFCLVVVSGLLSLGLMAWFVVRKWR